MAKSHFTKSHFTKHQKDTAILVLMESSQVRSWVEAEARAFHVDLETPEGLMWYEHHCRKAAKRMIR